MKNLARHIDLLLRTNDCVILPGFGGFIAHTVPAYYASEEHLYYPPTRNISFNASITMNDGLLAQSYMKSYQVDYARATYMIDVAIEELRDMLDEVGSVTLPRIGLIKQDIYQTIQFIPETAGISSPKHFGLSSFFMQELGQLQAMSAKTEQSQSVITQTEKTFDLHISKHMLRQVMSTAAVLLLLLMVSLPIGEKTATDIASLQLIKTINSEVVLETSVAITQEMTEAVGITPNTTIIDSTSTIETPTTTGPTGIEIESNFNYETAVAEAIATESEATEAANVTVAPEAEQHVAPTPQNVSTRSYHIIVASLPNHRGADEIVNKYTAQGYTNVSLVERDGRIRISLTQFNNKDEANSYLSALRTNEAFANAWLLAVSN
jgi:cell division septation protein DedD